jgi:hypothetical protein
VLGRGGRRHVVGVEGAVGQPVHQLDHIPVLDAVDGLLYGRKHTDKGLKKRYYKQCCGSGSSSQRYGSGSFYHQAKIVRKTLIPPVFLFDFLSLKNDVSVPSKSEELKKN